MAMDLRQVPWGLEQMSLCFHVVQEKMEKGVTCVFLYDHVICVAFSSYGWWMLTVFSVWFQSYTEHWIAIIHFFEEHGERRYCGAHGTKIEHYNALEEFVYKLNIVILSTYVAATRDIFKDDQYLCCVIFLIGPFFMHRIVWLSWGHIFQWLHLHNILCYSA